MQMHILTGLRLWQDEKLSGALGDYNNLFSLSKHAESYFKRG